MKLDHSFFEAETETIGNSPAKTGKIQISEKNTKYFISLLTKVYSDPIGSVVREITSNCFDAHRKLNKVAPVIIRHYIESDTNQEFIDFIDQGTGLSPVAMDEIYMSLGESDKRESDDYLGAFGLGSKSPFSYVTNLAYFYVITKVDGLQYTYLLNETQAGITYDLLSTTPVESENGTTIRIPFEKKSDKDLFRTALIQQLKYFDDVFVYGFDKESTNWSEKTIKFNNDYTIVEHKTFKYRADLLEEKNTEPLHVAYGPVNYPIDFKVLGIEPINLNVALKFELGELDVILNREQLKYTDRTIEALKNRIQAFKEEIRGLLLTPDNLHFTKMYDYIQCENRLSRDNVFLINKWSLPVASLNVFNTGFLSKTDCKPVLLVAGIAITEIHDLKAALRRGYKSVLWSPGHGILTTYHVGNAYERLSQRINIIWGDRSRREKHILISNDLLKHQRAFLNDHSKKLVSRFDAHRAVMSFMRDFFSRDGYRHLPIENLKSFTTMLKKQFTEVVETTHTLISELNIPEDYGKRTKEALVRTEGTVLAYNIHSSPSRVEITTVEKKFGIGVSLVYTTKDRVGELRNYAEQVSSLFSKVRGSSRSSQYLVYVCTSAKYRDILKQDPNAYSLDEVKQLGVNTPWLQTQDIQDECVSAFSTYKTRLVIEKLGITVGSMADIDSLGRALTSATDRISYFDPKTMPLQKAFFDLCSKSSRDIDLIEKAFQNNRGASSIENWKRLVTKDVFTSLLDNAKEDKALLYAGERYSHIKEFMKDFFIEIIFMSEAHWQGDRVESLNSSLPQILEDGLKRRESELNKFRNLIKCY